MGATTATSAERGRLLLLAFSVEGFAEWPAAESSCSAGSRTIWPGATGIGLVRVHCPQRVVAIAVDVHLVLSSRPIWSPISPVREIGREEVVSSCGNCRREKIPTPASANPQYCASSEYLAHASPSDRFTSLVRNPEAQCGRARCTSLATQPSGIYWRLSGFR